jgi:hypothetical protein
VLHSSMRIRAPHPHHRDSFTMFERWLALVMAAIGCALFNLASAQDSRQSPNIVRQVDHILIASSDARELFSLLSGTFQLPVVWPMSDYGSFASGGVAVGNVNLEVLKANSVPGTRTERARFVGFALEPGPLQISLAELEARRIRHGAPMPFRSRQPSGAVTTLWTTVGLPEVSRDDIEVFLCAYEHDVSARRLQSTVELRSRNGGPLSVHSLKEIVYGTPDVTRMQEQWQRLLSPVQPSSRGVWAVGGGPAIRVTQADEDGIQEVVLKVTSLQQARRFLQEHGLLGTEQATWLTLAASRVQGLRVTLVE